MHLQPAKLGFFFDFSSIKKNPFAIVVDSMKRKKMPRKNPGTLIHSNKLTHKTVTSLL